VGLHLSQIDEADELLTNDPLALLIGMALDQQIGQTRNGGLAQGSAGVLSARESAGGRA
jgi:hypothetical protein